jgi:hypothetical protein
VLICLYSCLSSRYILLSSEHKMPLLSFRCLSRPKIHTTFPWHPSSCETRLGDEIRTYRKGRSVTPHESLKKPLSATLHLLVPFCIFPVRHLPATDDPWIAARCSSTASRMHRPQTGVFPAADKKLFNQADWKGDRVFGTDPRGLRRDGRVTSLTDPTHAGGIRKGPST